MSLDRPVGSPGAVAPSDRAAAAHSAAVSDIEAENHLVAEGASASGELGPAALAEGGDALLEVAAAYRELDGHQLGLEGRGKVGGQAAAQQSLGG